MPATVIRASGAITAFLLTCCRLYCIPQKLISNFGQTSSMRFMDFFMDPSLIEKLVKLTQLQKTDFEYDNIVSVPSGWPDVSDSVVDTTKFA